MSQATILQITTESSATGFISYATLYGEGIDYFDSSVIGIDTASVSSSHIYTDSTRAIDTISTVLPDRVYGNYGTLTYFYDNWGYKGYRPPLTGETRSIYMTVWGTSQSTVSFSTSTWYRLAYKSYPGVWFWSGSDNIDINTVKMHSTLSITTMTHQGGYGDVDTYYTSTAYEDTEHHDVFNISINYNSSQATILATNAAVGTFNWVSLDGGIIG